MFGIFGKKEVVEDLTPVSLHDFPKTEYDAYWEIISEGGPGNYISTVRIYPRNKEAINKTIRSHSFDNIIKEQNSFIREKMQEYKK